MAVYTDVAAEDLAEFHKGYAIGELLSYKGIAEGVENSNFLMHTSQGAFILTLYEKRVAVDDLPYFLSLMAHLAGRGVRCPQPARNRKGEVYATLAGRPAAVINFLEGMWPRRPTAAHCAGVGEALAKMHLAGRDFPLVRKNPLSVGGWRPLFKHAALRANEVQNGLYEFLGNELDHLERCWPSDLREGIIHADLFPDNVFFLGDMVSVLIECTFYCYVIIHTDGACSGNPGPGGWGAILKFGDAEKELSGGEPNTTNNRMELLAAISALEALKRPAPVDIYTDSQYLRGGITGWIFG